MDKVQLMYDLEKVSLELDILIKHARILAVQMDVDEYSMMDTSGNLIMAPLVTAKAHALASIALLHG